MRIWKKYRLDTLRTFLCRARHAKRKQGLRKPLLMKFARFFTFQCFESSTLRLLISRVDQNFNLGDLCCVPLSRVFWLSSWTRMLILKRLCGWLVWRFVLLHYGECIWWPSNDFHWRYFGAVGKSPIPPLRLNKISDRCRSLAKFVAESIAQ